LLAQKVIPAAPAYRGNRKKGTLPNASSLKAIAPSLGKEASALFSLIVVEHFVLNIINQLIVLCKIS